MLRLEGEDQKAVDWLMQSLSNSGANDKSGWALSSVVTDDRRLSNVGRLLDLLGACPAFDPPQNLAARTLEKIQSHHPVPMLLSSPITPSPESLDA